jgi:tRNA(adenine34) deaminase
MIDVTDDQAFMQRALELAARAEAEGEVPVGALIVLDGEIIGEGWNRPIGTNDPSAHAEMVAIRAAAQRLGNYRLTGATLYVTLEPCPMCAGAMIHARVARVVYGATDPLAGSAGSAFDLLNSERLNHRAVVQGGILGESCSQRLKAFFQQRRARGSEN